MIQNKLKWGCLMLLGINLMCSNQHQKYNCDFEFTHDFYFGNQVSICIPSSWNIDSINADNYFVASDDSIPFHISIIRLDPDAATVEEVNKYLDQLKDSPNISSCKYELSDTTDYLYSIEYVDSSDENIELYFKDYIYPANITEFAMVIRFTYVKPFSEYEKEGLLRKILGSIKLKR